MSSQNINGTQARTRGENEKNAWAEEDTFRIMVATDNHIGYLERDPVRGQDSINAFKEILQLAVKHDVDFILLGGDLFHDNRPSRDTLYQVMGLLREYTMNDRPVQIELLSDPDEGKAPGYSFPAINYEDSNLNVGMPVFSIHGNHDDPQGAGPEGALCALDMLSVAGLINYMGKVHLPVGNEEAQNNGIAIKPILLRKGSSKLGLYGIGNVKDQRMHFELRSNHVRMFMPKDKDKWFNILVLHQNRVPHGPQQSVPEGMFDDSIDFVLWGHEHDCRVDPEDVPGKRYKICQPGSSVATSLSDGEALEKQVALLEICGKEFRMTPITLRTVRPFVLDEMVLSDVAQAEGWDINDRFKILKTLKEKVEDLIQEANQKWEERNEMAKQEGEAELPPMLPLVRLKVDTTDVTEMSNPVRFGQEFQNRIANPRDVLSFHRAKKALRSGKVLADQPELSIDDPDLTTSEKISRLRVQTLVREFLAAQEMQLLPEASMSEAIEKFVDKDDIHAIETNVKGALKNIMKRVQTTAKEAEIEEKLDELLEEAKEKEQAEYAERQGIPKPTTSKATKGKSKARESDAESMDSMLMDVDFEGLAFDDEPPPPKKTATRGKKAAPAKKPTARGRKKTVSSEEEDQDDDDSEEEEEEVPKPVKRTNRAAILSQTATKAKRAPAKKAAGTSKQATLNFAPPRRATGTRAAASRAKKKTADIVELDSDDD